LGATAGRGLCCPPALLLWGGNDDIAATPTHPRRGYVVWLLTCAALPLIMLGWLLSPSTPAGCDGSSQHKGPLRYRWAGVSGQTYVDASAANADCVAFHLFGGGLRLLGQVALRRLDQITVVGWRCHWNSATLLNGSYVGLRCCKCLWFRIRCRRNYHGEQSRRACGAGWSHLTTPSSGDVYSKLWSPDWFGNGNVANGRVVNSDDVSVDVYGLELKLAANGTMSWSVRTPSDG